MAVDVHLKQKLEELDEKYGGEELYRIFGPTSLTWNTTDSSRMYMFTSHLKQTLTLLNPDVPRLATGMENSVGKYNNAYKKLDGTWEVKQIIPKFTLTDDLKKSPDGKKVQIFMLVLYNRKTNTYDMIEKPVAESLTEKFGFVYNTEFMESLEVGDRITDRVLYKSTAYDDHMAYRYGKNARVFFSTSTDTIEDAIVIRKGWADQVKSVEIDEVQVPINDNDVLLNVYGDRNTYLAFPEVGQEVKDSLSVQLEESIERICSTIFKLQTCRKLWIPIPTTMSVNIRWSMISMCTIMEMEIFHRPYSTSSCIDTIRITADMLMRFSNAVIVLKRRQRLKAAIILKM